MAVTIAPIPMSASINYTHITDSSSDWGSVPNDTYFYDKTLKSILYKDISSNIVNLSELYNQQIQNEGSNVTKRSVVNYVGNGVDVSDIGGKTVVDIKGVTPSDFHTQFMVNQYCYFLPSDNSALYDTLRAGGSLTSVGTTSALTENPMGVLFTTPTAVSSIAALYGNTFGGSILGVNFQFELHRRFRLNSIVVAQRFFTGISSLYNASAPTNIDPLTQINSIGVCKPSTNSNLLLMWNDATGTASSLDTGFSGISTSFTYSLRIFKTFGVASITIELTQITNSTGATSVFSTTITSDYNTGVNYFPVIWMGNSTTATGAVSFKDYGCTLTKRNIISL